MRSIKKHFNGGILMAVFVLTFFAAPPLYSLIDETAGRFDAGYLHAIIFGGMVTTFSGGLAWFLTKLTAAGAQRAFDKWCESEDYTGEHPNNSATLGLILYLVYLILTVIAIVVIV